MQSQILLLPTASVMIPAALILNVFPVLPAVIAYVNVSTASGSLQASVTY